MNILAQPFVPESIRNLSDRKPLYIYYPDEEQFHSLGFINTLGWRRFFFPSEEPHQFKLNHWEQEPDWECGDKVHDLSFKSAYLADIWDWLKSEWRERRNRFQSYIQHETKVFLEKEHLARVSLPGLADADPPILPGDWIQISFLDETDLLHQVRSRVQVLSRAKNEIICAWPYEIALQKTSSTTSFEFKASVKLFENPMFSFRLLEAIKAAEKLTDIEKLLDPPKMSDYQEHTIMPKPALYFVNEKLNPKQKEFIQLALQESNDKRTLPQPIKILFGPAGTGKTMVAIETIMQIILKEKSLRTNPHILVCAPSISAADTLASRLLTEIEKTNLVGKDTLFLFNNGTRTFDSIPTKLLSICAIDDNSGRFKMPDLGTFLTFQVVICTCSDASMIQECGLVTSNILQYKRTYHETTLREYKKLGIDTIDLLSIQIKDHWTHLLIDEAAQASEAETLVPITTCWSPQLKIFLFGDPRQLSCRLYSKKNSTESSLLERLLKSPLYCNQGVLGKITNPFNSDLVVLLSHNYRSHPSLLMMPSILFYHDELLACADTDFSHRNVGFKALPEFSSVKGYDWPVYFVNVNGKDIHSIYESGSLASWANRQEADLVVEYVSMIIESGCVGKPSDIGIISPFRGQVSLIRKLLRKVKYHDVNVGNVLDFQGKEYQVIIISSVRSVNALQDWENSGGFVGNPKEFNVAITRAMSLLIWIGCEDLLEKDRFIYQFLAFCHRNKRSNESQKERKKNVNFLLQNTQNRLDGFPSFDDHLESGLEKRWLRN